MYTPKHFEEKDKQRLIKFMREYNFATIVNYAKNKPWATHIPFLINEAGEDIILKAHMAKKNPQWVQFNNKDKVLVIFQEPHTYISPSLYDHDVHVPTWNYIAVHAYGIPEILDSKENRISILEESFSVFEPKYREQWVRLPSDYKEDLLDGIVAFQIKVTRLEGKFKLSQNRTEKDRETIIENLSKSEDNVKKNIAKFMRENQQKS